MHNRPAGTRPATIHLLPALVLRLKAAFRRAVPAQKSMSTYVADPNRAMPQPRSDRSLPRLRLPVIVLIASFSHAVSAGLTRLFHGHKSLCLRPLTASLAVALLASACTSSHTVQPTPSRSSSTPAPAGKQQGWRVRMYVGLKGGGWALIGTGGVRKDAKGVTADISERLGDNAVRLIQNPGDGTFVATAIGGTAGQWIDLTDPYKAPQIPGIESALLPAVGPTTPVRKDTVAGKKLNVYIRPLSVFSDGKTIEGQALEQWVDGVSDVRRAVVISTIKSQNGRVDELTVLDRDDSVAVRPPHVSRDNAVPLPAWMASQLSAAGGSSAVHTKAESSAVHGRGVELDARIQKNQPDPQISHGCKTTVARNAPYTIQFECQGGVFGTAGGIFTAKLNPPSLGQIPGSGQGSPAAPIKPANPAILHVITYGLSCGIMWLYRIKSILTLANAVQGLAADVSIVSALGPATFGFLAAGGSLLAACGLAEYYLGKYTSSLFGDPHITTWDGTDFGLQARGEFVYLESPDLVIQERFDGELGSWTKLMATAVRTAGHVIEVYPEMPSQPSDPLTAVIDGSTVKVPYTGISLPGNVYVARYSGGSWNNANVLIVTPDGSYIIIENAAGVDQNVSASLTPSAAAKVTGGLGGTPDGNRKDDFVTRSGALVPHPETIAGLYGTFAAAWRVTPGERLFTQGRAQDFRTPEFTQLPGAKKDLSDYSTAQIRAARKQCKDAGVTDPSRIEDCAYDVLAGGADWAKQDGGSLHHGGTKPPITPASQRVKGDDPLLVAADQCQVDTIKSLLAKGSDPNLRRASDGWTPLLFAAQADCADGATALLDAGADPAVTDDKGFFPLYIAAQNGSTRTVALLIKRGVNTRQVLPSGDSPLLIASFHGHTPVVRSLLAVGAGADIPRDNDGVTPLLAATQEGHGDIVDALLAAGANPNRAAWQSETPLMIAASNDQASIVPKLLAAGANPNARDDSGLTALHYAAQSDDPAIVKALLAHGADRNAKDNQGHRPIDYAGSNVRSLLS